MESPKPVSKRRKQCPVCHSEELTRIEGAWLEKIVDRMIGVRNYKCFMCGHVFELRATNSGRPRTHSASED